MWTCICEVFCTARAAKYCNLGDSVCSNSKVPLCVFLECCAHDLEGSLQQFIFLMQTLLQHVKPGLWYWGQCCNLLFAQFSTYFLKSDAGLHYLCACPGLRSQVLHVSTVVRQQQFSLSRVHSYLQVTFSYSIGFVYLIVGLLVTSQLFVSVSYFNNVSGLRIPMGRQLRSHFMSSFLSPLPLSVLAICMATTASSEITLHFLGIACCLL